MKRFTILFVLLVSLLGVGLLAQFQTTPPQRGSYYRLVPSTVAALPASPAEGTLAGVNDATVITAGTIVAGTGAHHVLVYFEGTNWRIVTGI